ncbi:MAG: hypothetical protein P8O10_15865 [Pseudorhodobacter sp.]|nr:hypothetical protein [Pseudorhodobacter sp.]
MDFVQDMIGALRDNAGPVALAVLFGRDAPGSGDASGFDCDGDGGD